jgi:hypothetical protein
MVIVGQTLLGSNGSYPVVDSLPVITQKLIEILHVAVNVWQRSNGVNLRQLDSLKIDTDGGVLHKEPCLQSS